MKIAIITFHNVYNFGGVLQALALQTYLTKQGHEVHIIDYRPKYLKSEYRVIRSPLVSTIKIFNEIKRNSHSPVNTTKKIIRYYLGIIKQNLRVVENVQRKQIFTRFITDNLTLTTVYDEKNISSFDSLKFDVYICGSDQIWNKQITDGKYDPAYFLNFLDDNVERNSYSASSGDSLNISDEILKEYLLKFKCISVREKKDQVILSEMLQKKVYHTIDPTLLLDFSDYSTYEKNCNETDSYILVYMLEKNEDLVKMIEWAKSKYKSDRVIDISPSHYFKCDNLLRRTAGPGEFLYYIKNAGCVLTNSFHGTAFSVIYHTPFLTFPHSKRSSRMIELLASLGLDECLYKKTCDLNPDTINWENSEQNLENLRSDSKKYIEMIIEKT